MSNNDNKTRNEIAEKFVQAMYVSGYCWNLSSLTPPYQRTRTPRGLLKQSAHKSGLGSVYKAKTGQACWAGCVWAMQTQGVGTLDVPLEASSGWQGKRGGGREMWQGTCAREPYLPNPSPHNDQTIRPQQRSTFNHAGWPLWAAVWAELKGL